MRRERLTQHNPQLTRLFQSSRRIENSVNPNGRFGLDRAGVLVYLHVQNKLAIVFSEQGIV
jgi:hypothetical protein